jgi:hypothetical protein
MNPNRSNARRRQRLTPGAEALETRNLLTGGGGSTIAILPGQVAQAGGTAAVTFTIDPKNFTLPRGKVLLGVDVAAASNSSVAPKITSIAQTGTVSAQSQTIRKARLTRSPAASATDAQAVTAQLGSRGRSLESPISYRINLAATEQTSGSLLVGVYLPGDVNGDGTVAQTDINLLRGAMGSVVGDQTYSFDADSNRDGMINRTDIALAQQNLGVKTTIAPLVTANLDPASDTGGSDRITAASQAHFTGQASGNSTITFSEVNKRVPDVTATTDANGNYSLNVALAEGSNTFRVSVTDSAGQNISGLIDAVIRNAYLASLSTANTQNQNQS